MESGVNKSLFTMIAVVIFGIFLSLSYWLFSDEMESVLADVMDSTSEMTSIKLENNGLIPTDAKYFGIADNNDGTCTILNYDINGGKELIIPTTINGLFVTKIGGEAFYNKGLTSVILPEGLVKINNGYTTYNEDGTIKKRWGAFSDNNIKEIKFPASVKTIGYWSFVNNGLTKIDFGSLIDIGGYAFYDNALVNLEIPSSVKYLRGGAFQDNDLKNVNIDEGLTTIDGWVFGPNKIETLTLPSTVITLNDTFIVHNNNLKVLNIPKSLDISFDESKIYKSYNRDPITKVMTNIVYYPSTIVHYYY